MHYSLNDKIMKCNENVYKHLLSGIHNETPKFQREIIMKQFYNFIILKIGNLNIS